jgi:phage tail P2-like protein
MFDLLPPNASFDDQQNARCMVEILERKVNLSTLPLEANVSLLPHLAVSYDVDITGLTEDEARKYLHSAFEIHRYKGTVYAVKKAIEVMFDSGELVESFDDDALSGGDFDVKVTLDVDFSKVYHLERFKKARELIYSAKNVRSHLNRFAIALPQSKLLYGVGVELTQMIGLSSSIDITTKKQVHVKEGIIWLI